MTGRSSDSKIRSPPWGSFPAGYHPFAHEPLPTLGRNATLTLSATPCCGLDATKKLLSKGPVRPAKRGRDCLHPTHTRTPHLRTTPGDNVTGISVICVAGWSTEEWAHHTSHHWRRYTQSRYGPAQSVVRPLQVQSHRHRHGRVNRDQHMPKVVALITRSVNPQD